MSISQAYMQEDCVVSPQGYEGTVYVYKVGFPSTFVAVTSGGTARFFLEGEMVDAGEYQFRQEAIEDACSWLNGKKGGEING